MMTSSYKTAMATLCLGALVSAADLVFARSAGTDPGPGIPACSEQPGWYSHFDGTPETMNKYWFNPSGQRHGDNSRWWLTNGILHSDQSTDRRGGCIYTKKQYKNVEAKMHVKPSWGNDAGYFFRATTGGRGYQVVLDYVAGDTKAVGGVWGEGGLHSINYKPFGFSTQSTIKLRSEWFMNGKEGRPNMTAADWSTKIWKVGDFNWMHAKVYHDDVPWIDTWVNGEYQMVHYEDPATEAGKETQNGHVTVQVHQGAGQWSIGNPNQYKALLIREIKGDGKPLDAYPEWTTACVSSAKIKHATVVVPTASWTFQPGNRLEIKGTSPADYRLTLTDMQGKTVLEAAGESGGFTHRVSVGESKLHVLTIRTKDHMNSFRILAASK